MLFGDNRGFSTDPNASYRMVMLWDTDSGKIVFDVAPSHTTGFVFDKGEIRAQPVGDPSNDWKDKVPVVFRNNEVRVTPGESGVTVDASGINSLLPAFATDQKVTVELPDGQGLPPHIKLKGDNYPNFETVQYFPNKPPIMHGTDEMWNPPVGDGALAAAGLSKRDIEWVGSTEQPGTPPILTRADIVNAGKDDPAPMPVDPW